MNFVLYSANTSIMKNYLTWLPTLIVIAAAMSRPVKEAMTKKAVDKNISFVVYKGVDYASSAYNNTSAQLHVTVEKVNGVKHTQVWSKTFDARQVKRYPSLEQATLQTVKVPKVAGEEYLEITYTITYNSGGSKLQMQSDTVVGNNMNGKLDISI
jgi:hypothetical protein